MKKHNTLRWRLAVATAISLFTMQPALADGHDPEADPGRCGPQPYAKGCAIADVGFNAEFGFDGDRGYGLRGSLGIFVLDQVALTLDGGPMWVDPSLTRFDLGLRGRYFFDIEGPYDIALAYWLGSATIVTGKASAAFRHIPEFSFIGELADHFYFGMYVGIPMVHDNGDVDTGFSMVPTLTLAF